MEIKTSYQIRTDLPFLYDGYEAQTKYVSVDDLIQWIKELEDKYCQNLLISNPFDNETLRYKFDNLIKELETKKNG